MKSETAFLLSVGLIVKNEEENLPRCLDSLKLLFKSLEKNGVGAELVIVDTGSTDKTAETAAEYTDKVYSFSWVDDFAAARNFGLTKCGGDWFMYLDADEALDTDVSALVDFLTDDTKRKKYKSARLILKNYADSRSEIYTESRNLRLVRLDESPRFRGAVHESLPILSPCFQIEQTVHHYGYVGESGAESLAKKHSRNMPALLKMYKQNSKDPRTLAHLFYSCESKDKEKYLTEWYNLLSLDYRDVYSVPVYAALIQTLMDGGCPQDALFYAEEYLKSYGTDTVTTLSVLALTVCLLSSTSQPELAADFFENYDELYKSFKSGELDTSELSTCVVFFGISDSDYAGILLLTVSDLIKLGQIKRAKELISTIDTEKVPSMLKPTFDALQESLR